MTFVMFAWALLNSYTRLYLGVHYPGDLIVGAAIGCSFGFICYIAAQSIQCRWPRAFSIGGTIENSPKAIIAGIAERCDAILFRLKVFKAKEVGISYIDFVWLMPAVILAWIILRSLI